MQISPPRLRQAFFDEIPGTFVHVMWWRHEATVFPGSDAVVVTPAEQAAADERAQRRFGAVQSEIAHHHKE